MTQILINTQVDYLDHGTDRGPMSVSANKKIKGVSVSMRTVTPED